MKSPNHSTCNIVAMHCSVQITYVKNLLVIYVQHLSDGAEATLHSADNIYKNISRVVHSKM